MGSFDSWWLGFVENIVFWATELPFYPQWCLVTSTQWPRVVNTPTGWRVPIVCMAADPVTGWGLLGGQGAPGEGKECGRWPCFLSTSEVQQQHINGPVLAWSPASSPPGGSNRRFFVSSWKIGLHISSTNISLSSRKGCFSSPQPELSSYNPGSLWLEFASVGSAFYRVN